MSKFQKGDKVVLDKNNTEKYSGQVIETEGDEVHVKWDTGPKSWYHSYELSKR